MKTKSPELVLLGKNIRRYREKAGFSQDNFAYEVGLGRSYYGSLERGEINASFLTLVKIVRALDIELKDIIPQISG
ncbi:hypothetical protein NBRC116583_34440 [Arenicella sp. 4NH20-0111]|uniref:helix-turn-helix transcriptional regulator n=1 Tax=Arenicella sp. 4NH20-0111 TaxID=3127648 RepID=UPI003108A232